MAAYQQEFNFAKVEVVNINNHDPGPEQSKDEIVKTRVTPANAEKIDSFCRGRRISRSEFLRALMSLDDSFFDHIETFNREKHIFLPLAERLSKKF